MSKLRKFLVWFADAMIRGAHARAGVFLPKKLTLENVFDELWPGSSLGAREELIWMTPYPFVDSETVIESLKAMRERWGPAIGASIKGEMDEFDRIWEETRPQREAWENEGGALK